MKNNIGLLYLSLHNHLSARFGFGNEIHRKEFFCRLGRHYLLPKEYRPIVLKEMQIMGLLKPVNKNYFVLINKAMDTPALHRYCMNVALSKDDYQVIGRQLDIIGSKLNKLRRKQEAEI